MSIVTVCGDFAVPILREMSSTALDMKRRLDGGGSGSEGMGADGSMGVNKTKGEPVGEGEGTRH